MNSLLAVAVCIVAGLAISRIVRLLKLPNVTAFLIGGLLIGPSVLGLIPDGNGSGLLGKVLYPNGGENLLEGLEIISSAALGFIAYSIGAEFKWSYLKRIGSKPVTITFFQGCIAAGLVDLVLIALYFAGVPGFDLPMCIVLGAIATATAPAATLMVVRQYKARGKVSDILLPVVAMDDALGLVIFAISMNIAQTVANGTALTFTSMILLPLKEIALSLLLGSVLGYLQAVLSRCFRSRGNKLALTVAVVFAALALCEMWDLSNLLCIMMISAVMTNIAPDSEKIIEQTDRFTPPLFLLFFVISGAELQLSVLPTVGLVGVTYILVRAFGKWFGAWLGSAVVKADPMVKKYLGLTLIPQAGVAIGMAQLALTKLPQYGSKIQAVVLAATLVYELVGPVITKEALIRAGEIEKGR